MFHKCYKIIKFLAAMSSSRSDDVPKSVCVCVCGESFCLVGALKAFEARCFEGFAREFHGVLRVFTENSRVFQGS